MPEFRKSLPQLGGDFFLTDGGIETTLIFLEGLELPDFAAFHLLKSSKGQDALRKYFRMYPGFGPDRRCAPRSSRSMRRHHVIRRIT